MKVTTESELICETNLAEHYRFERQSKFSCTFRHMMTADGSIGTNLVYYNHINILDIRCAHKMLLSAFSFSAPHRVHFVADGTF